MHSGIQIHSVLEIKHQSMCRAVFDQTWAKSAGTEITPNLLQAMIHSGAYLSGAFIGKKCVGASFAFPATSDGLHFLCVHLEGPSQ